MNQKILETSGWIGVLLVLSSYGLLSLGIIDGQSLIYHGLILVGSLGLVVISWYKKVFQPAFLNIVFCILAVVAIARITLS